MSSSNFESMSSDDLLKTSEESIGNENFEENKCNTRKTKKLFVIVYIGFCLIMFLFSFIGGLLLGKFYFFSDEEGSWMNSFHHPSSDGYNSEGSHLYGWKKDTSIGTIRTKHNINELSYLDVKLVPIIGEEPIQREYRCILKENINFEERRRSTISDEHDLESEKRRGAIAVALIVQGVVLFIRYALFSSAIYVFARSTKEAVGIVMEKVYGLNVQASGYEDEVMSSVEDNVDCEEVTNNNPHGVIVCFGKCEDDSDVRCEEDGLNDINQVRKKAEVKYESFCKKHMGIDELGDDDLLFGDEKSYLVDFKCLKWGESPSTDFIDKCLD